MIELSDWEWGIGSGIVLACFVAGGLINRQQDKQEINDQIDSHSSSKTNDVIELGHQLQARNQEVIELNQQLQAREKELNHANEENELTLLQLHQAHTELEHYFIENRELQQRETLVKEQLERLQRIKKRILIQVNVSPIRSNTALRQITRRQQKSLRRFKRLHQGD